MPRNSLTNGKTAPDSFNTQLDECAYPLVMALAVGLTGPAYYEDHIKPAANFVASHGPSFGPERWEEQGGFSPSTISAEIAGLIAAAIIADRNGDHASAAGLARRRRRVPAQPEGAGRSRRTGRCSPQPYFIRLSKTGDPNAAINYGLGNGRARPRPALGHRRRLPRVRPPRRAFRATTRTSCTRSTWSTRRSRRTTANGDGFFRYNDDGYGDRATDGRPWAPSGQGNGHLWPVLGRRARTVRARHRQHGRRGQAPAGDERDGLRRRPDPRAGVGAAEPRARRRSEPTRRRPRSASSTARPPARPRR